jgi:NAD+ diphosphatase
MSSPNFFAAGSLNRMSDYRTREKDLIKILESADSLFIPICNSKNLMTFTPETRAVFVKYSEIKDFNDNDYIFLGRYNHNFYFTVNVNKETGLIKNESVKFDDLRKVVPILNREEAALLAYAKEMIYWKERVKFCGKCGSKTNLDDGGHRAFCPNCNSLFFPHTDPAVIVIVTNGQRCLLARQPSWPPKRYSVIAGFVEPGESLEDAVSREVFEETGISLDNITYRSSQPWPFPGSIMLGFSAEAKSTAITLYDKELEDAKWFSREEIIEKVKLKELKLPTGFSISFRLLEEWFNAGSKKTLKEMISSFTEDFK